MSQLRKVEPDKAKFMAFEPTELFEYLIATCLSAFSYLFFCQIHILEHFFTFSCTSSLSYENITYMIPVSTSFFFLKPEYRHYYFHQFATWVILWSYEVILRSHWGHAEVMLRSCWGHMTWIECDSRITRWTCTVFKDQSGSLLIKMAHTCSVLEYLEYLKGWMISILSH